MLQGQNPKIEYKVMQNNYLVVKQSRGGTSVQNTATKVHDM